MRHRTSRTSLYRTRKPYETLLAIHTHRLHLSYLWPYGQQYILFLLPHYTLSATILCAWSLKLINWTPCSYCLAGFCCARIGWSLSTLPCYSDRNIPQPLIPTHIILKEVYSPSMASCAASGKEQTFVLCTYKINHVFSLVACSLSECVDLLAWCSCDSFPRINRAQLLSNLSFNLLTL